MKTQFANSLE